MLKFKPVHNRLNKSRSAVIAASVIAVMSAFSQTSFAQLTGLSNPSIMERALEEPSTPKSAPPAPITLQEGSAAPEGAEDILFALKGLKIKGGTIFDVSQMLGLDVPVTGSTISVADIYRFADIITQLYRKEGYALSFALVPTQEIADGMVVIEVIEGHIVDLEIQERNLSDLVRKHILNAFARFAAKGITRTDDLEMFLLSVNDYPGISARGIVAPGDNTGKASLILEVEQRRDEASLGYQNYLSESLGRDVFLAEYALFGQWSGRDEARISLRQAPDPLTYRSATFDYSSYIDDTNIEVYFRASESKTKPEKGSLADLNFTSSATSQQLGMRFPLWRQRKSSLYLGAFATVNDSLSKNDTSDLTNDKVRTANIYADYEIETSSGGTHLLHFELEAGVETFQARANSREGAHLNHGLLRISERYRQPLLPLEKGQLDATFRLFAQVSLNDKPAFSNAECSFGGRSFGIGMDAGTLSGENCALASLQFNWQRAITNSDYIPDSLFTLLGRLDAGTVRQTGNLVAGEKRQQEAISAALGAQFVMDNGLIVNLERATQLKNEDEPAKEGENTTNISVNMRF